MSASVNSKKTQTPPKVAADKKARNKKSADTKKKSRPRGRPIGTPDTWTLEYTAEVAGLLIKYVEVTVNPSIAEFCYKNRVHRQRLYDNVTLDAIRDWLISKKISALEKAGMRLTKDHGSRGAFIIFALKQLGWRDKTEVEHSGVIGAGVLKVSERMTPEEWAAVASAQQNALMAGAAHD